MTMSIADGGLDKRVAAGRGAGAGFTTEGTEVTGKGSLGVHCVLDGGPRGDGARGAVLAGVLLLLVGLVASSPAVGLTLDQDFDGGSLDVARTTVDDADGDAPVITLSARRVAAAGRTFHFDISGVKGEQPVFRVARRGDASGAHRAAHRYVFSLDGGKSWTFFANGAVADGQYRFSDDSPFAADRVRIAYAIPHTVADSVAEVRALRTSRWVRPTASGDKDLVVGRTPGTSGGGYTDELGREIPAFDLHGFHLGDHGSNPPPGQPRTRVVLMTGNHPSEVTGTHTFWGLVRFLLGDEPEAAALRRAADFYVYPLVNPEGRYAGFNRSSPEHRELDHNRDWVDQPRNSSVRAITQAITTDTGGQADYFLDFHSFRGTGVELWGLAQDRDRPFFKALKARRPDARYKVFSVATNARQWATRALGVTEGFTPETGFNPGWTVADYHALGRDFALVLHELILPAAAGDESDRPTTDGDDRTGPQADAPPPVPTTHPEVATTQPRVAATQPDVAATQPDVVKEPRAPAYTVAMTAEHTARVARSPFVSPTPSAVEGFVIGRTRGWAENPEIPPQDILAYQITDPRAKSDKTRVVLITGNHNTEHTGSWAFQGMVDFLVSDEPEAAALRRKAVFYVYPLVNPDGRFTRRGRGNPELTAAGLGDHNRVWNTSGRFTTIDILTAAIRKDTGGSANYMLDFHSSGSTFFYATREVAQTPYAQAVTARDAEVKPRISAGHPGMTRRWAASEEGLSAPVAVTPELVHGLSTRRCLQIGRAYGLALHDVVVAGFGKSSQTAPTTQPEPTAAAEPAAAQ